MQPVRRGAVGHELRTAVVQVVDVERGPGGHVAQHDAHDDEEPLEEVLVPHVHAVRLARLKLRQNSAEIKSTTTQLFFSNVLRRLEPLRFVYFSKTILQTY